MSSDAILYHLSNFNISKDRRRDYLANDIIFALKFHGVREIQKIEFGTTIMSSIF